MLKAMSLVAALTLMAGAAHAEKPREQSKSKKVMVQELTLDQFQQKVYNLSDANASSSLTYLGDKPAIVDFYASWWNPYPTMPRKSIRRMISGSRCSAIN